MGETARGDGVAAPRRLMNSSAVLASEVISRALMRGAARVGEGAGEGNEGGAGGSVVFDDGGAGVGGGGGGGGGGGYLIERGVGEDYDAGGGQMGGGGQGCSAGGGGDEEGPLAGDAADGE